MSDKPKNSNEQIHFRLFQMPCCEHLLCWVNPRTPNYCPECGARVLAALRTDGSRTLLSDTQAWLKHKVV